MQSIVLSYHLKLYNEIEVIKGLMYCGLQHFHLRKPDLSQEEYRSYLESIPSEFHNRIIAHSHFELVKEYGLKGYYVPSSARGQVAVASEGRLVKSTFANSFDELDSLNGEYDYVIMGPIFKSISRPDFGEKFPPSCIKENLLGKKRQSKVLAIGGIKEGTTELALSYGFDGVVILGAIWTLYMETLDVSKAIRKYEIIRDIGMVMKN